MTAELKKAVVCGHCGAEADLLVEGFESVEDVLKKKKKVVCKSCGQELGIRARSRKPTACEHCGAEADITLEGMEKAEDVIRRNKKLACKACGKEIPWEKGEELRAVETAMEAEKEASQFYAKTARKTKDPRGRDMLVQLSEFEMNHFNKLKELAKALQDKGEWILYSGTSLKKKAFTVKADTLKGQDQLSDMDALKLAIREEKKAGAYYRSMAELARDPRGKDMYRRLAGEEELHERLLNDQYYSLHNSGIWSWGD
jgi:rubrerythrin/predicted RNA-binding Zn-ribbon protein involved in translation (DUF1610 family)